MKRIRPRPQPSATCDASDAWHCSLLDGRASVLPTVEWRIDQIAAQAASRPPLL